MDNNSLQFQTQQPTAVLSSNHRKSSISCRPSGRHIVFFSVTCPTVRLSLALSFALHRCVCGVCISGVFAMPDNAKTDEVESTVGPRGLGDNDVDDARRHRTECCDARQLLSETLRLRRAAQQQRAAAGNAGTPATAPTAAASGPRCSAAATTTTTLKRRKKPRVDRDSAMDQPQPRIRRIMFHEYKGPSDDDSETVTIAGPISTAQLPSSTSLCFPSPGMMTTAFCPKAATSIWKDIKVEQAQGGNISQLSVSPSTTDFGGFRPTSSLPRFAELQRSLRSPIYRQDFSELTSPNHLQLVQTSQLEAVSCVSGGPGAPPCQRSSLVDAQFCRLTSTTSMTSDHVVTSPALSPLSVEQSTSYSLSQRCQLPSLTSPIDVTSRSLTSGVVDHIVACFPSSATANRPKNGNKSVVKFFIYSYAAYVYHGGLSLRNFIRVRFLDPRQLLVFT